MLRYLDLYNSFGSLHQLDWIANIHYVSWFHAFIMNFTDCSRYHLLDGLQSHNDLGKYSCLLPCAICYQLSSWWEVQRIPLHGKWSCIILDNKLIHYNWITEYNPCRFLNYTSINKYQMYYRYYRITRFGLRVPWPL